MRCFIQQILFHEPLQKKKKLYVTVIGSLIWVMRGTVYDTLPVWLETIILSLALPPVRAYSFAPWSKLIFLRSCLQKWRKSGDWYVGT